MARRYAWLGALLVISIAASAQSSNPFAGGQPGTVLVQTIEETTEAAVVDFVYVFQLNEPRSVFLKISPTDTNPAYDPDGVPGWKTAIALVGPGGRADHGETASNDAVEFGTLQGNVTYQLELSVHAPAGQLTTARDLRLDYILTADAQATGTGSPLQPSVDVRPVLKIEEPPPEPEPEEPVGNETEEVVTEPEGNASQNETVQDNETADAPAATDDAGPGGWLEDIGLNSQATRVIAGLAAIAVLSVGWGIRSARMRKKQEARLQRLERAMSKKKRK